MGEQDDAYSLYKATAQELLNRDEIRLDPVLYRRALGYQQMLSENIELSRLHGDSPELNAARCKIINELNKLAVWKLDTSFVELCARIEPTQEKEPTRRLPHISDPLRWAQLGSEGPMHVLLEDVIKARSCADCEAVLRLCDYAVECAIRHGRPADLALVYLYQADAQAQVNRLEAGIELAERARQILKIWGDHHNAMVAQLLLALLKAAQNLDNARVEYLEALILCRRLESWKKEAARSEEALSYGRIVQEIQQALDDVGKVIREQHSQKYFAHSIPILRLTDGPDMISRASRMIDQVAPGEFRAGGRTYYLYPADNTTGQTLELETDAVHFALPVRENGWLGPASKKQDYALVQQESPVTQEGPAVLWMHEEWIVAGRFTRDATTGTIRFVALRDSARVIGGEPGTEERGCVVGLFKPVN